VKKGGSGSGGLTWNEQKKEDGKNHSRKKNVWKDGEKKTKDIKKRQEGGPTREGGRKSGGEEERVGPNGGTRENFAENEERRVGF